jgi:hypothetical protein
LTHGRKGWERRIAACCAGLFIGIAVAAGCMKFGTEHKDLLPISGKRVVIIE